MLITCSLCLSSCTHSTLPSLPKKQLYYHRYQDSTSLKCQFTTSYWKNWHSFSPLPAFIIHLTSTPPQIPTSNDSCLYFLYPILSYTILKFLSLWVRLSIVLSSVLFTHETQWLPPLLPGFLNTPADTTTSLLLSVLPGFQATDVKPESLCGGPENAVS